LPANRGGGKVRRGSWLGPKPTPAGAAAIACRATRLGCERKGGGGLRLLSDGGPATRDASLEGRRVGAEGIRTIAQGRRSGNPKSP